MRNNPLQRLRDQRIQALRNGESVPVAFSFWDDDDELLTVDGEHVFEIHFNDMIDDWFGISAAMVVEALLSAGGKDVLVHLNSPGGMVTEGLAIHSTLKQYAGNVTVRVEGIAASAASFVMLAADSLIIEPNAMVMIHDASNYMHGTEAEYRREADLLGKISENIASMYAVKSGTDQKAWRTAMLAETWYVGQEAVDAGLIDAIAPDRKAGTEKAEEAAVAREWGGIFATAPKRAEGKVAATTATLTAEVESLRAQVAQLKANGRDMPVEPVKTEEPPTLSLMDTLSTIDLSALLKDAMKGVSR